MLNPSTHKAPTLPPALAMRLAKLARVPANERGEFCDRICETVRNVSQRDRRSTGKKPGRRLVYAAIAARTLQKEYSRINEDDRDWVENIKQSELQFLAGEIHDVETTVMNLSMLLNSAVGWRSPLPPSLEKNALKVRDQIFRELVFGLLAAAEDNRGELTFNKNSETGTLAQALDLLRDHVPPGLVPEPLRVATIQRLKTDFSRLRKGPAQEPLPATDLEQLKADFIRRHS